MRLVAAILAVACFGASFVWAYEFGGMLSALGLVLFGLSVIEPMQSPTHE